MSTNGKMRLHFSVGYVPDWNAGGSGTSLALNIEGNDQGLRFLIERIHALLEGNMGAEAESLNLSDAVRPGFSVEPSSMKVSVHRTPG